MKKARNYLGIALALLMMGSIHAAAQGDRVFKDLKSTHWAFQTMIRFQKEGFLEGYPENYFSTKRFLTRYEFGIATIRLLSFTDNFDQEARLTPRDLEDITQLVVEFEPEMKAIGGKFFAKTKSRLNTLKKKRAEASSKKGKFIVRKELIAANNAFGFQLFDRLRGHDADQNLFFSPTSIALVLEMLYNGASGETKQAMARTLALQGIGLDEMNQANAALLASLENPDAQVKLNMANSLWIHAAEKFDPAFVQRSKTFYGAEIGGLRGAPETINAWVSTKTQGKITHLLQKQDVVGAVAVLLNTIYFKGAWTKPFPKNATHSFPFTLSDGSKKSCPMMQQPGKYRYVKGDGFQAVSLPYGSGRTSLYLFLPDEGSDLKTFLANLNAANWEKWMGEFKETGGVVVLPRFRFEYEKELKDALTDLGMGVAFTSQADFRGMAPPPLWIDKVKHKTFVEVNEEGTTAAAATAAVMTRGGAEPFEQTFRLIFTRPFFCALRDNETGALLFLGIVASP